MRSLAVLTMMMMFAFACSNDDTDPPIDAPPAQVDAPNGGGEDAAIDGPASNVCTGAAYDPCTDNAQCMSGNCRAFGSAGIQVCTQACDANNPCPMQNGAAVPCNNMGLCRPQAANACTR